MTLPLGQRVTYVGNGATSVYAFAFKIFAKTDLVVTVTTPAGVETTLAYPADYTVSGTSAWPNGGTITLTAGSLTNGYTLVIRRVRPLTQATDIRNQQSFLPESLENEYDNRGMIDQQLQEQLDRCLQLLVGSTGISAQLPAPSANKAIGWNSGGTGLTNLEVGLSTDLVRSTSIPATVNKLAQFAASGTSISASAYTAAELVAAATGGNPNPTPPTGASGPNVGTGLLVAVTTIDSTRYKQLSTVNLRLTAVPNAGVFYYPIALVIQAKLPVGGTYSAAESLSVHFESNTINGLLPAESGGLQLNTGASTRRVTAVFGGVGLGGSFFESPALVGYPTHSGQALIVRNTAATPTGGNAGDLFTFNLLYAACSIPT